MANTRDHIVESVGLALLDYFVDTHNSRQQINLNEILEVGAAGALGGIAPDIFEPAISPTHRKSAHSVAAVGISVKAYQYANTESTLSPKQRRMLRAFSIGYVGHIISDSSTPAGVPIL